MTLNIEDCISQLVENQRLLDDRLLYQICSLAREVLAEESNVVNVSAPITV